MCLTVMDVYNSKRPGIKDNVETRRSQRLPSLAQWFMHVRGTVRVVLAKVNPTLNVSHSDGCIK